MFYTKQREVLDLSVVYPVLFPNAPIPTEYVGGAECAACTLDRNPKVTEWLDYDASVTCSDLGHGFGKSYLNMNVQKVASNMHGGVGNRPCTVFVLFLQLRRKQLFFTVF